ncbi:glycosyltransferase family 4 protein [Roseofilum capinflatum]|uniref:Glycosyltransferase family 4 protein n=1 Tax=Roseofilum capinflatum BLCC-M114 TaxID=3022440 RepID=A0ABT7B8Q6_9CYAN|nr:glycosyltransferase family 4 protein [Roseofilum capinflatum]MDJ1174979.1 glycosyltransferase family 4 protein [Roseofilum capinflatum BLCC-M114]
MQLDYITTYDVFKPSSWPKQHMGMYTAGSYLSQEFQAQDFTLNHLGPLEKYKTPVTRLKWLFYRNLFKQDYYSWAEPVILKSYAKQIEKKLCNSAARLALCPENAIPFAYLKSPKPLVLWTDAPLGSLINFYSYLNNLSGETTRNIYRLEKSAFDRCDRLIFTSDWAAEESMKIYNLPSEKVSVIPWGANLKSTRTLSDIELSIQNRNPDQCQLLFIGVDWERKGGDFAVEVAKNLNNAGVKTDLNVVGCQPPKWVSSLDFVNIIGYIDKSTTSGQQQLDHLFSASHFLILHTLADCSPHVLIEANSYGVPCVSTNIGGIPTIIQDGKNGKTFSLETESSVYSEYILEMLHNREAYQSLALSSFQEYESRLNWKIAIRTFKTLIQELLG